MKSYTIDIADNGDGWTWRLYDRGGTRMLQFGGPDSLEGAISEAKQAMLVEHRKAAAE